MIYITKKRVQKAIELIDYGLSCGLGTPEPGEMCVEAAICHALGLPHGDDPKCVHPAIRALKIIINDASWSSPLARAKGLRKLAVLQLGSKGIDIRPFVRGVAEIAGIMAKRAAEYAAEYAASAAKYATEYAASAAKYATEYAEYAASATESAAEYAASAAEYAAESAAYAAKYAAESAAYATESAEYAAEYDKELLYFTWKVEKLLIRMNVPGVKWLELL